MRQQPNYTCMPKNLLKLYCIRTWDTLWDFFCFVLFCFVFFPFDKTMTELLLRHHLQNWRLRDETKIIKTETLLHLNLEIFFFHFFYLYIYFFYFQSSLCLSNACSAYCWLVYYLSLFISLKPFCCFFVLVFLLVCLFVFLFFFNLFAFHFLSPFHSKYNHCYYYKLENTYLHTVQGQ
jgi:hypothetical protein